MAGFNTISLKLKEMYQMITLGGDAELELVDSLDPFSEVLPKTLRPLDTVMACPAHGDSCILCAGILKVPRAMWTHFLMHAKPTACLGAGALRTRLLLPGQHAARWCRRSVVVFVGMHYSSHMTSGDAL